MDAMEASGRPDAPVVSVVMPVHNAGVHLSGAIESVLAQTFRDFELLLVDDGATDGSGGLCDEYAVKDSRVRVKHGRNGGISASRNAGLAMARGKWVAFCDHDDFMEPDLLETALGAVEGTGHKLVKFDHATFRRLGDGTLRREYAGFGRGDCEWTAQEVLTAEGYPFFKALAGLVWDGLYLREFIEACGLRFDESFKFGGEDFDFMTRCIAAAGGGVWTARTLYRHYYNVGVSTSSSFHLALVFDYLRTAHAERRLFPAAFSDAGLRFVSFGEWTIPLIHFVFAVPGCILSLREQAAWLARYYDELVGSGARFSCARLPAKRRFLAACAQLRAFLVYLLLKRAVLALRRCKMAIPEMGGYE